MKKEHVPRLTIRGLSGGCGGGHYTLEYLTGESMAGIAETIITCVSLVAVDGDTVRCDGQLLRDMGDGEPFVSGYDTPELRGRGACPESRDLALAARDRMAELLATEAITVEDSGQLDTTPEKRPLVVLRRPDGTTIGAALIAEGLARVWPADGSIEWCP